MSFTVKFKQPLYAGISLLLRITLPGSSNAIDDGDVVVTDTSANGQFTGECEANAVGVFEYILFRGQSVVQTGWLRRSAGKTVVLLDDPRDFPATSEELISGGSGYKLIDVSVRLTSDDSPIPGALVWLVGSSQYAYTDQFGRAQLRGITGSSYTVACGMPRGFADVTNKPITVAENDHNKVEFTTQVTPITTPPSPDDSVYLISAYVSVKYNSGIPYEGAKVTVSRDDTLDLTTDGFTAVYFPKVEEKTVNGVATFTLRKGTIYQCQIVIKGEQPRKFTFTTPTTDGEFLIKQLTADDPGC